MSRNVGDLGKLIVAKGFTKLPKVLKIAKSGHASPGLPGYLGKLSKPIVGDLYTRARP